jgi:hypothetical protein
VLTPSLDALGLTRRDHVPLLRRIYASGITAWKDPSLICSSISSLTLVTHYSHTLFSPRPFPTSLLPRTTPSPAPSSITMRFSSLLLALPLVGSVLAAPAKRAAASSAAAAVPSVSASASPASALSAIQKLQSTVVSLS